MKLSRLTKTLEVVYSIRNVDLSTVVSLSPFIHISMVGWLNVICARSVILDEAHTIKNHKTKKAEACSEVKARFRWALTGTP
jgi:transcription termination factor 2